MKVDSSKYKNIVRDLETDAYEYTILRFNKMQFCNSIKKRLKSAKEWCHVDQDAKGRCRIIITADTYDKLKLTSREERNIINRYSSLS
ncbi:hypothetical protein N356_gp009 [Cellulophaga phage phi14:2]|uniref:Uncharacterized protein n=1 Tax=Cellulophaga phage phi14:2 TaxID=1327990 RepID=R9ZZY9_9CAUD|nr:hypothetical protein N356_gp009 [Cellulophaga phage phi14:2]AGO48899.1 hypothetical protein Phi14:2_gp021 [Cellulophaga phage phi14:2]